VSVDRSVPAPEPLPPEPPSVAGDATPLWDSMMACCRVVVSAGFIVTALVGAFVTPPAGLLLVAPLTGAGAAVVVTLLNRAFPAEPWARRSALLAGATGAAFVPFFNGVTLLGNAGGVIALLLLVLGSGLVADWMLDVIEDPPSSLTSRDER
jgi:hypothetical protein